jgi:hypothetical protein
MPNDRQAYAFTATVDARTASKAGRRHSRRLDLTGITRTQWYSAAADSMPFRRERQAGHRPFRYLFGPALDAEGPGH